MAPQRILLTGGQGPLRDALTRALTHDGHDVQVSETTELVDRSKEHGPDVVVGSEVGVGALRQATSAPVIALSRPVNMEELRRTLRDM